MRAAPPPSSTLRAVLPGLPTSALTAMACWLGDAPALGVRAGWAPMAASKYGFQERWPLLKRLEPADETCNWSQDELAIFGVPTGMGIGSVWRLEDEDLLPIVRQLHADATFQMHAMQAAGGGFALLRARNEQFEEVALRIHVDFPLDDRGSWYTPGQLAGYALVERATGTIHDLRLELPKAACNVDLNWAVGKRGPPPPDLDLVDVAAGKVDVSSFMVQADIGYVPQLDLVADPPLTPRGDAGPWLAELDESIARKRLAERFYAFEAVEWRDLDAAAAAAKALDLPLHVVALFGALGDESC